ncbi:DUF4912 domain-containing protein [Metabacillus idriensis]|uniref:DUF4912 domain-containing protein n=1 Tax=Metabacillus idriensis TaxID=324768 RepID=UPI003D2D3235
MTLLMRTPSMFFLQWNIGIKTELALSIICSEKFSSLEKTIRFYQRKKNSLSYKDFKISEQHGHLFIEGIGSDAGYYAELILHTSENSTLTVLKSNEFKGSFTNDSQIDWTAYKDEPDSWKNQFSAYTVYNQ